jgi:hypothetical protein
MTIVRLPTSRKEPGRARESFHWRNLNQVKQVRFPYQPQPMSATRKGFIGDKEAGFGDRQSNHSSTRNEYRLGVGGHQILLTGRVGARKDIYK